MPISDRLQVEYADPRRFKAYDRNARVHSDAQIAQLERSMDVFGFVNPVLVDESDEIIAGHGRTRAAINRGLESVPFIVLAGLSEEEKRALRIADNKLALNATWNPELLSAELGALVDFRELLGFAGDEVELLLHDASQEPEKAEDQHPPPVPDRPATRRGDIWQCGNHRLMCGDCREPTEVAALILDRQITVAFTSPPYAEQRDYDANSGFKPIPPEHYVAWFALVAENVGAHLAPDGSWFVNIKPAQAGLDTSLYVFDLVIAHVREWGWHFATEFCWERPGVPKQVTRRFKSAFEPIYQFAKAEWKMRPDNVRHESDAVPKPMGPGVGATTWREKQGSGPLLPQQHKHGTKNTMSDMQGGNFAPGEMVSNGLAYPSNRLPSFAGSHDALGHAAAFPVGLPQFFVRAYSDPGDAVFDPFVGSGSTIIADRKSVV